MADSPRFEVPDGKSEAFDTRTLPNMADSARFGVPEGKSEAFAGAELEAKDALGSMISFDGSRTRNSYSSENSPGAKAYNQINEEMMGFDDPGTQGEKGNKTRFSVFNRGNNWASDSTRVTCPPSSISLTASGIPLPDVEDRQETKGKKTRFSVFNRGNNWTSDSTRVTHPLSSISLTASGIPLPDVEDWRETKGDRTDRRMMKGSSIIIRGSQVTSDGEGTKYPPTTYSLIALGDSSSRAFGIFVFVIQAALLWLLIIGHYAYDVKQNFQSKDLVPTRITQLAKGVSTIAFFLLTDCCLSDASSAINICPNPFREHQIKNHKWVFFSCILQLIMGLCCVFAALFLIVSRFEPFLIVLSITTVGTVAKFDETAFTLAGQGRYTLAIAKAAAMVETTSLPHHAVCGHLKEHNPVNDKTFTLHRRHVFKGYIGILFLSTVAVFLAFPWYYGSRILTSHVRVHFKNSTGLHNHTGCYVRSHMRGAYFGWAYLGTNVGGVYHRDPTTEEDEAGTHLGFCETTSRWAFFTGDAENPCNDETLLQSKGFPRFTDVSSTFNAPWFYPVKDDKIEDYDVIFPYLDHYDCRALNVSL